MSYMREMTCFHPGLVVKMHLEFEVFPSIVIVKSKIEMISKLDLLSSVAPKLTSISNILCFHYVKYV